MNDHVRTWGKSSAVRLPASILAAAGMKPGDPVEIRADNGRILIESLHRKGITLDELIAGITPDNRHEETDWGPPVGREFR